MLDYKFYTFKEFEDLSDDLKWDVYSEISNEFKKLFNANNRQYKQLVAKDNFIIELKSIIHKIIDEIGSDKE